MSSPNDPGQESFDTASSQFNAGLRTCRAVLSNYRSLIGDESEVEEPQAGFSAPGERDEHLAE